VILGGVDDFNRPFVKLELIGFSEPLTAFIDTGFNGAIILDEYQAERTGFEISKLHTIRATLASEQVESFWLGQGRISWLGEEPFVSAYVLAETERQRRERRRRKRGEEIVLGVELLLNCRLEIDFPSRSVVITRLE
jgi:predicted aspartyl protease